MIHYDILIQDFDHIKLWYQLIAFVWKEFSPLGGWYDMRDTRMRDKALACFVPGLTR